MFGGKEKSRTFASAIEKQTSNSKCPDGGIGRRAGLKHQWIHFHPGSTPGLGTKKEDVSNGCKHNWLVCPDGGIGRRAGLKHQWIHFHPGSTPGLGTGKGESSKGFLLFCLFLLLYFLLLSCFYLHTYTLYIFVDNQNVSRVENMYKECREAVFSTQTAII